MPTCRSPRRCGPAGSATTPGWRSSGSPSDDCTTYAGATAALSDVQGVLIPGGFGVRGIEGKIGAIKLARINKIPVLGLCLGLQCIVIEAARNLAGLGGANSAEFDANAADPVIATMADQHDVVAGAKDMGGTMRLGAYPARLADGLAGRRDLRQHQCFRAAPAPLRGQQRLPRRAGAGRSAPVRDVTGFLAGGVRRAGPGPAPVPGRHPGAPGVQVPADPAAPAVRGVRPGRAGLPGIRAAADRG